jgi:hypothetical protein
MNNEMSLEEYVNQLHSGHRARVEYEAMKAELHKGVTTKKALGALLGDWSPEKHGQMVADRVNEQRKENERNSTSE